MDTLSNLRAFLAKENIYNVLVTQVHDHERGLWRVLQPYFTLTAANVDALAGVLRDQGFTGVEVHYDIAGCGSDYRWDFGIVD